MQCAGGMANGFTQASSVIPVVRSNDAASLTVTKAFLPLNNNELPYFPRVVHTAFTMVPVFPVPDASDAVVPAPSLNEYAATSPETIVPVVALATFEYGLTLPCPDPFRSPRK